MEQPSLDARADTDRPTRAARGRAREADALEVLTGVRLVVIDGPDRDAAWTITAERCSIGGHASNPVRLADPTVSRFHCELVVDDRGVRVRDLDSRNGTILDGTRVVEAHVRDGSVLILGATWLRLELGCPAAACAGPASFGSLVGTAPGMRAAFAALAQSAPTDATVLLLGETGTGKEEAAAALHAASRRANGPFVVVDCGALPRELLLSELFGHEKGAFTGATERRHGAFAAAAGGTVFLDEIGELPLDLQPQLLRVLERREIRMLGSARHAPIDVRVVAATNRDLRAEVNAERFRADLYYRLAVVTVRLPPLRERPADLPPLVRELLVRLGAGAATIERLLDDELLAAVRRGAWTGNVRELRNYLERCLVFGRALPVSARDGDLPVANPLDPTDPAQPYAMARRAALDRFERGYVHALLARHGGRVQDAATAAGLGRVQLWRLARKHAG
jgi:two-component system, NtrC family, response regulator GlrR